MPIHSTNSVYFGPSPIADNLATMCLDPDLNCQATWSYDTSHNTRHCSLFKTHKRHTNFLHRNYQ